jgi:prepilin peptidase CpaA
MSHAMHHWLLGATIAACAIAALVDLRTGEIPNWLTLGLFGAAPIVRAAAAVHFQHASWTSAVLVGVLSLLSGIASALVPLALARHGGLGLGDVKLFAAIGAACGIFVAFYAQTYAYVFAMLHALIFLARKKKLGATFRNIQGLFDGRPRAARADGAARHEGFTELKFAPAILGGMCVAAWAQWRW